MGEAYDWQPIAANNNQAPPAGWPENAMEYHQVNDAGREILARLARWRTSAFSGTISTGGTGTAYTLTSGLTFANYVAGMVFTFTAHTNSTGPVALNVDFKGAGAVVDARGVQLDAGDFMAGGQYTVIRGASNFKVLGHMSAVSMRAAINDTLRNAFVSTGAANVYTIAPGNSPAYANGQLYAIITHQANTGAAQVSVDAQALEPLLDLAGQPLVANDILANQVLLICRVAGSWRAITSLPIDLASNVSGVLAVANGGTGGNTATLGRDGLGLGQANTPIFTGVELLKPGVSSLAGNVRATLAAQSLTIAELGGTGRGVNLDLTQAAAAGASNLFHSGNAATKAEMEAFSSLVKPVVPGIQHQHKGHPKAWARVPVSGGVPSIAANFNVSSATDTAQGQVAFALITAFASADWAFIGAVDRSVSSSQSQVFSASAAGMNVWQSNSPSLQDPSNYFFAGFGVQ